MRTVPVMLSTAKIRNSSWRYYIQQAQRGGCEYFLRIGEAPGRWCGRALDDLGLTRNAVVTERELEGLFGRALHPKSGRRLGRAWRADAVTGYDLCFSAPKSVSALWAIGVDTVPMQVVAAHRAAVSTALEYLDAHASFSRVGTNGHTQVSTGGFAAAVFPHRTSRAGDPQLHSHALVINKIKCPDGVWRTIDGHEIYAHKKSAGTVYQAALRNELTRRLGVGWTPGSKDGQAEIVGVPTVLMKAWSKRAGQVASEAAPVIAAYEKELGRPLSSAERTAVAKVAVLKTRPGKEQVDIVALGDRWTAEAKELGWDGLAVQRSVGAAASSRPTPGSAVAGVDLAVADALTAAGARRAVFSRSDLAAEVAARIPAVGFTAEMVRGLVEDWTDRALADPDTVALRPQVAGPHRASDARYASRATVDAELRILNAADAGRGAGLAMLGPRQVREAARRGGLDGSQQAALVRLTGSGDAISVLIAPAGTGKTTALGVAVHAWQAAGYRTILLAPSARAAAELRDATLNPADTVAKFLHEQGKPTRLGVARSEAARYRLRPGDVVIVDEASMLATRDLDALTDAARAAGAKLNLVGDPAQIGVVDAAGGMLPALAERLHAPTLETVHRFTEAWERRASLRLRRRDVNVVDDYVIAGRVHDCPDDTTAYQAVLDQYVEASTAGRRALMLARTHHDVDALNALARDQAIATGQVHGPVLVDGPNQWRAGDRLRATRNNRAIPVGEDYLRNGDQFTVTGADRDGLVVQTIDGAQIARLPADYVTAHTTYGWASTIDAAQGATVDHGILLARPGLDREHLYVGLTRGRTSNHVYVTQPTTNTDHHATSRTAGARPATEILNDALNTSDAQLAAHTRLPDHNRIEPATCPARPQRVRQDPPLPTRPARRRRLGPKPVDYPPPLTREREWLTREVRPEIGRGR
jgi:conjugative relaxase-like TrwC/TraI family protein